MLHPDEQSIKGGEKGEKPAQVHHHSASQPELDGLVHCDDDAVVNVSRMNPVLDVYTLSALTLVPDSAANKVVEVQSQSEHEYMLTTWE